MATNRPRPKERLSAQEREDLRDFQIIRRASRRPMHSFRKFVKEMGYEIKDRPRR